MALVKVEIDGKRIMADSSKTIYQVAKENGIEIPVLCHDEQLEPFGSCFVCVVEVKGARGLIPSCATKVNNGMIIRTQTAEVRNARKAALELLLSNHYADCNAPCQLACPADIDVQGYIALTALGKYHDALKLIKEKNPLPAVCGRVCTRPCEVKGCRRNILDSPVAIDYIKRFLADTDLESGDPFMPDVEPQTGKKIAIVGAGPAGLSAAYYLAQHGHTVHIYEAMPEAGGMLRYGIPEYRLPKDLLDQEIAIILDLGVELYTNSELGDDFTITSLKKDGYEAIYLGMGAWSGSRMYIENETADGVLSGIEFLRGFGSRREATLEGTVVVVGGGNTAIDCARTSLRIGANQVKLLYRRTEKEMPANDLEIHEAKLEGVDMEFLTAPIGVLTDEKGKVTGIRCIRMELGEPDDSGRRKPIPLKNSEFDIMCSTILAAIGQGTDIEVLTGAIKPDMLPVGEVLNTSRWKTIETNPETYETSVEGVFSGGDVVTGAATAIEAIAAGRKGAYAIHAYLTEGVAKAEPTEFSSRKDTYNEVTTTDLRYQEHLARQKMPELEVAERITNFKEVELGYTHDELKREVKRCLECGCAVLFECDLRRYATEYGIDIDHFEGAGQKYEIDRSHPLIELDPNKCILCGRCVRICSEVLGISAYGFIHRGFDTIVRPALGKSLTQTNCISCGMCVETCPTGAISANLFLPKPGPWKVEKTETVCNYCGVGCRIQYGTYGGSLLLTRKVDGNTLTYGSHCIKGKFGYHFINSKDRLKQPYVRAGRKLQETDWKDAFDFVSLRFKELTRKYDPNEFAVFISPSLTNEEIYFIQKFARIAFQTKYVSSFSQLLFEGYDTPELVSTATYPDVTQSDRIVVAHSNLPEEHVVADILVKKALRKDAKVIYIHSETNRLSTFVDYHLQCKPGTEALVMQALTASYASVANPHDLAISNADAYLKEIRAFSLEKIEQKTGVSKEQIEQAARCYVEGKKRLMIFDRHYQSGRRKGDNFLFSNFALLSGAKMLVLNRFNNSQGLMDLAGTSMLFPGYQAIDSKENMERFEKEWHFVLHHADQYSFPDLTTALEQKKIKVMLVFGEDPLGVPQIPASIRKGFDGLDFLFVADLFPSRTSEIANVILPLATHAETSGSFTNSERRVQQVRKAIEPQSGYENWEFLFHIAAKMGLKFKMNYKQLDDIFEEIQAHVPIYKEVVLDSQLSEGVWNIDQFPLRVDQFKTDLGEFSSTPSTLLDLTLLDPAEKAFDDWLKEKMPEKQDSK
jgi:formate dehydrogenase major subunit